MVGVSGDGLEDAAELVRPVGVLTAAVSVEHVRQQLEIALEVELASEPREEDRQLTAQSDPVTNPRRSVKRPVGRLGVLPTTDS